MFFSFTWIYYVNILSRKQITIAENRIKKATSQLEVAWLYHDLARYYSEIRKFELARVYARKCIVEAKQCNNLEWIVNAKLLITRINVQQHNRTDAKMEINAAIELAKQMENDTLREYLEKVSVYIFTMFVCSCVNKYRRGEQSQRMHAHFL